MLSIRQRKIHLGIPFEGRDEAPAVFDRVYVGEGSDAGSRRIADSTRMAKPKDADSTVKANRQVIQIYRSTVEFQRRGGKAC
jgi:hypothetical protein